LLEGVALKLVPLIVTVVPTGPVPGLNPVIVGAGVVTVKLLPLVAVCVPTFTVIVPVVAPAGTATVKCVVVAAETVAAVPLNMTVLLAGVALKFVPVIVTDAPTTPLVGLKLVIVGAAEAAFAPSALSK
jgi:hypothetical protein